MTNQKIVSLKKIVSRVKNAQTNKKKVGTYHGVFNLMHLDNFQYYQKGS